MRSVLLPACGLALVAACKSSAPSAAPADAGDPACFPGASGAVDDAPIHTPRWAFEPWLSKDYSSSDDTRAFVKGSLDRGIPVGVAVLDSPWETNYDTMVPDETPGRYAGFDAMVAELASENVKLVVWLTAFVNSTSFDFETGANTHYDDFSQIALGEKCGFFVDPDHDEYAWYKGTGGAPSIS